MWPFKRLAAPEHQAHGVYTQTVEAARQPVFYKEWRVPDTLDGRFDMLVLHLFLLIHRLESEGAAMQSLIRQLSEAFFADMDRSLREMGVGDTGIGVRVKKMAQAFYGRLAAYKAAIGEDAALKQALKRNVWRDAEVDSTCVAALAEYIKGQQQRLAAQPMAGILQRPF